MGIGISRENGPHSHEDCGFDEGTWGILHQNVGDYFFGKAVDFNLDDTTKNADLMWENLEYMDIIGKINSPSSDWVCLRLWDNWQHCH